MTETRSLIIDSRDSIIRPRDSDRLTYTKNIEIDPNSDEQPYQLIEKAFAEDVDTLHMPPLTTRRYLGEIGATSAYLLSPWVGKRIERDFVWHRLEISDALAIVEEQIDPVDAEIFSEFMLARAAGNLISVSRNYK